MFLNGDALRDLDERGLCLRDDSFLLLFNAHHEALPFTMPAASFGEQWMVLVDTNTELGENLTKVAAGHALDVRARSLLVLSRPSLA
jgi:glycogen operon protein